MALTFGVYFALKLAKEGRGPTHLGKAVGFSLIGLMVFLAIRSFVLPKLTLELKPFLILIWLAMAVPAVIQLFGWPDLFKALIGYGLAARIPVVIIMFFAMRGDWGTHYDYVGMPEQFQMPLWPRFFWLAFFPQLIFWAGFTVLTGALTGSIAVALFGTLRSAAQSPQARI